jgi:hypothetical protein
MLHRGSRNISRGSDARGSCGVGSAIHADRSDIMGTISGSEGPLQLLPALEPRVQGTLGWWLALSPLHEDPWLLTTDRARARPTSPSRILGAPARARAQADFDCSECSEIGLHAIAGEYIIQAGAGSRGYYVSSPKAETSRRQMVC